MIYSGCEGSIGAGDSYLKSDKYAVPPKEHGLHRSHGYARISYPRKSVRSASSVFYVVVNLRSSAFICGLLLFLLLFAGAASETPKTYYVPQSFDFAKNFYNSYGSPDITATIIGSNEFERGQTVTLKIDLMNRGKFLGFESDRTPSGADEIYAAKTEIV